MRFSTNQGFFFQHRIVDELAPFEQVLTFELLISREAYELTHVSKYDPENEEWIPTRTLMELRFLTVLITDIDSHDVEYFLDYHYQRFEGEKKRFLKYVKYLVLDFINNKSYTLNDFNRSSVIDFILYKDQFISENKKIEVLNFINEREEEEKRSDIDEEKSVVVFNTKHQLLLMHYLGMLKCGEDYSNSKFATLISYILGKDGKDVDNLRRYLSNINSVGKEYSKIKPSEISKTRENLEFLYSKLIELNFVELANEVKKDLDKIK